MMHSISWFFTRFTLSLSSPSCFFLSSFPSTSTGISFPASPSWMVGLPHIFRLPLSHTKVITKYFIRMKVTCWPYHIFSTKSTLFNLFIGRSAMLLSTVMITRSRTIQLVLALKCLKWFFTSRTYLFNTMVFILKSWHRNIITIFIKKIKTIEIEEKYCAIAVKRLGQGVLPL